ncbi:TPA: glycosyltransferase family 2 protein [Providencia rettgeri]|nr:glycosyltransferase family 2 protein [Providencia rettgeri]
MINNNILVSIIIPFYNASNVIYNSLEFIKKIIENEKVEVIFIDDGSTDNTIEIIESILSNRTNFKLFRKNNNGVSSARNLGISKSSGKYLMFLDADDQFIIDTFNYILNKIDLYDYDVMIFSYITDHTKKRNSELLLNKDTSSNTFLINYIKGKYLSKVSFSSCVYKSSIIHNNKILFDEKIKFGEDQLFLIKYLSIINRSSLIEINKTLLYYFHHENNATKKFNIRRFDAIKMLDTIDFQKNRLPISIKNSRINSELCAIATQYYAENNYSNSIHFLNKKISPFIKKSNIEMNILKQKDIVFTFFPKFYLFSYKTYKHLKNILKK